MIRDPKFETIDGKLYADGVEVQERMLSDKALVLQGLLKAKYGHHPRVLAMKHGSKVHSSEEFTNLILELVAEDMGWPVEMLLTPKKNH